MAVIKIAYEKSSGVENEIEVWEKERNTLLGLIDSCHDPMDFARGFVESAHGIEFQKYVSLLQPNQKILDVGFGRGETSIYLALKGHRVFSVDPSPLFCELLHAIAQKFSLPVQVYQSTGEAIDQIGETEFDAILFVASLHHCDDPLSVLKQCYAKLKNDGKVYLINEPILKCYRSKKWYDEMLKSHPEKLGHYGGNEHIYYYKEYLDLLSLSGFTNLQSHLNVKLDNPRLVIRDDLTKKINGIYCISGFKILLKFLALSMIKKIAKSKSPLSLISILKRLSLIPISFEGTRQEKA